MLEVHELLDVRQVSTFVDGNGELFRVQLRMSPSNVGASSFGIFRPLASGLVDNVEDDEP